MTRIAGKTSCSIGSLVILSFLAASVALAQDPYGPPNGPPPPSSDSSPGWRQFSNPPAGYNNAPGQYSNAPGQYNNAPGQYDNPPAQYNNAPAQAVPPRVKLPAGSFVTVRVDQMLSSDKNHAGDGFSATLTRPVVADGVVVAVPGQVVGGQVADAQKAGRVTGVSRLAVQLTDLTLVDGQQLSIETELARLTGPTSRARDASAIVGTGATGAAIGAAADLGVGAAIGAGAGAIVGTVGVLLTRGHPTVIYPESELTFRLSAPLIIATDRAPQAFHYVGTNFNNGSGAVPPGPQGAAARSGWNCLGYGWPPPAVGAAPAPYGYYPYPYPYPYYAPSFAFWYGPRFYYGGFYGRYGMRRR